MTKADNCHFVFLLFSACEVCAKLFVFLYLGEGLLGIRYWISSLRWGPVLVTGGGRNLRNRKWNEIGRAVQTDVMALKDIKYLTILYHLIFLTKFRWKRDSWTIRYPRKFAKCLESGEDELFTPKEKCSVRIMFGIRIVRAFKLDRKKSDKLGLR